MTWTYLNRELTAEEIEHHTGFVYLITNITTDRRYVGKKLFHFRHKKVVKGKNRWLTKLSDWDSYYGSNDKLKQDVVILGKENFKREVLRLCMSRSEMSYHEAKEQFVRDVLLDESYYNEFIGCKIRKSKILLETCKIIVDTNQNSI